jgi:hypothetical protein
MLDSLLSLWKILERNNLEKGKIYFGSVSVHGQLAPWLVQEFEVRQNIMAEGYGRVKLLTSLVARKQKDRKGPSQDTASKDTPPAKSHLLKFPQPPQTAGNQDFNA